MKLITLNTWGGKIYDPLIDFFKRQRSVDVFCLQETYLNANKETVDKKYYDNALNLHADIEKILVDHQGFFKPSVGGDYGLSIFAKKSIHVLEEGDVMIHDVPDYTSGSNHPRNLQYVVLDRNGSKLSIANVHGLWNGKGKTDTPDRLEQSKRIKTFMDSMGGKKILCGDLNLLPQTESLKLLETGVKNLVREYDVQSTRTSHYGKPEKFADYVFVSPDVKVVNFHVLPDEVSDHAPLMLEFE